MAGLDGEPTHDAPTDAPTAPPATGDWLYSWLPAEPQPAAPVDRPAVATLLLGLFGLVPLSIGLGVLWLVGRRREPGRRGRGYVYAGLALSGCWALGLTIVLLVGAAGPRTPFRDPVALRIGDCFTLTGALTGPARQVPVVPCTQAHNAEVFALVDVGDDVGLMPDQPTLTKAVLAACRPALDS